MELVIVLGILALIGYWVYDMSQKEKKDADAKIDAWQPPVEVQANTPEPAWPYTDKIPEGKVHVRVEDAVKVTAETTAPKCGCGRSSTGFCVGLHKLSAEEWATSDQNPNKVSVAEVTKAKAAKAVKKPAAKKPAAKKKST